MNTLRYRIFLDIVILLLVIHGWWFFVLPLVFFGGWKYPYFFETILAGVLYDSLFGFVPEMGIAGYIGSTGALIISTILYWFKKVSRT